MLILVNKSNIILPLMLQCSTLNECEKIEIFSHRQSQRSSYDRIQSSSAILAPEKKIPARSIEKMEPHATQLFNLFYLSFSLLFSPRILRFITADEVDCDFVFTIKVFVYRISIIPEYNGGAAFATHHVFSSIGIAQELHLRLHQPITCGSYLVFDFRSKKMNQALTDMFGDGDDSDSEDAEGNCLLEARTDLNSTQRIMRQLLLSRPAACGVMAFHNGTEEALLLFVERYAQRGNPASVLDAIDSFCYGRHWMMHCGDKKVKYLEKALQLGREKVKVTASGMNHCPVASSQLVCLEIGSYCGYSAVKIASTFGSSDNEFLYCVGKTTSTWKQSLLESQ
jgi:hypothetical protein